MTQPPIEHLWSSLWASRFAPGTARLRFQLGGEVFDNTSQPVPRFLQAHGRASAIADALFGAACVGVVAWNGAKPNGTGISRARNGFDALQSTGFQAPQIAEWAAALFPQTGADDAEVWALRGYEIGRTKEARDTIIWHAVAAEMAIYPCAPLRGFLIDPDARVMLHVYDDRGMDVIADNPAKLCAIHSTFADWLLATNLGHSDRKRA